MRSNSIYLTLLFILFSCNITNAAEKFTIKCVSPDSIAIPNAQVSISDNSPGCADNAESLTTGENGECSFSNINNGKYNLTAKHDFFEVYNDIVSVCADSTLTIIMQPLARMLEEVEVEAAWLRSYGTYDEMTLSKQNKEFGVSAIDAISSLPLFQKTIGGNTIKNTQGEAVSVFINGRPAKTEELLNMNGNNIKKIRYYQIAPMKYRALADGPVVEVFLNEIQQNEYSAGIFAKSMALDYNVFIKPFFRFRNNNHTLSINPSFNNFRLKPRGTETFEMGDISNKLKNISGSNFQHYNSIQTSYQFNKDRHLLYVNIEPTFENRSSDIESSITSAIINNNNISGSRITNEATKNKIIFSQIYYNYQFNNDIELTIEASNTFKDLSTSNSINQDLEGNGYVLQNLHNSDKLKINSSSGFAALSFPLFKGTFSALANIKFSENNINYVLYNDINKTIDKSYTRQFSQFYSVSWNRMFGKWGTDAQLIYPIYSYRMADGNKYHTSHITPKIRIFYNPDQKWSFTGTLFSFADTKYASKLNDYITFINPNFIIRNSPEQACFYSYACNINASFSTPDRKFFAQSSARYSIGNNSWESDYTTDGEYAVEQIVKTGFNATLAYSIYASWTPLNWLNISAAYNLAYLNIIYPEHHYTKLQNAGFFTTRFIFKNLSAYFSAYTPRDEGQGYKEFKVNWQFTTGASYRYRNLAIGLEYAITKKPFFTTTINTPHFYYKTTNEFAYENQQLSLSVSYNFKFGQAKDRKGIQSQDLEITTNH